MRKIEIAMCAAIRARRNWASGNTRVLLERRQDGKSLATVMLHGNHIATIGYDVTHNSETGDIGFRVENLTVSLAGWNTATTRSRLSAIVREFADLGPAGLGVSTHGGTRGGRDGTPSVHDANGQREIDDSGWHDVALIANS